jgi:hypothetical protein
LKWGLLGLALLAGGGVATLWLLFQHVPAWYRPVQVAPDSAHQIRNDMLRAQDDFAGLLARSDSPFEYRVTQDQLNAWLAAREDIWPLAREWLPAGVSEPFVVIAPEGVRVAATWSRDSIQTVVSADLAVRADDGAIHLKLQAVKSGSLPVPADWLRQLLAGLRADFREARLDVPGRPARGARPADLFDGVSVPNEGTWWEPRRRLRVIGLRLEPGAVTLTIRPLPHRGR